MVTNDGHLVTMTLWGLRLQFNHINGLELVCRAHQLVQEGLKYMFPDKGLVTVSSLDAYFLHLNRPPLGLADA